MEYFSIRSAWAHGLRFISDRKGQQALILIGMGLLHLGLSVHPMRVTLGLLITLAGFEVLYASLENSILVSGLLAVITLGLALTGSYLLSLNPSATPEKNIQ